MHGAASRRNEIYIEERDVIVSELSTVRLRWINKSDEKQNRAEQARDHQQLADIAQLPSGEYESSQISDLRAVMQVAF